MLDSSIQTQPQSPVRIRTKARKTNSLQNVSALKILLNAIALMPKTQPQIIELTGLCNSTVSRWLRYLHISTPETKNLVYIAEWRRTGKAGNPSACWALGYGMADALKPKPISNAQANKNWRNKQSRQPTITLTETGIKHVSR